MSTSSDSLDLWISLEEVLTFPAVQAASPTVLTHSGSLSKRQVKWVHVCEQPDMTEFVDAHHLVLTSGVGLGHGLGGWYQIIESLGRRRSSGLIIELQVVLDEVPRELIDYAEQCNLPLIALHRPSRFVDITQSVHKAIADRQQRELQRIAHVHETFTRLITQNASVQDIVGVAGNFVGVPAVLEDDHHRVLAFQDDSAPSVLERWGSVSRCIPGNVFPHALALSVVVGNSPRGRLVMLFAESPGEVDVMVAERAVAALALAHSRELEDQVLRDGAHIQLLSELAKPGSVNADVIARLRTFGFTTSNRQFFACLIQSSDGSSFSSGFSREISDALRDAGVEGVSAAIAPNLHHLLISAPREIDGVDIFSGIAKTMSRGASNVNVSFSESLNHLSEVPVAFSQAKLALVEAKFSPDRDYYLPAQVSGNAVLAILGDDPVLQRFVEGQLAPILGLPDKHREQHIDTLHTYLSTGQNVSTAAKSLFVSRPALYARLRKLSGLLGVDFSSPDQMFSLFLAVMAYRSWVGADDSHISHSGPY